MKKMLLMFSFTGLLVSACSTPFATEEDSAQSNLLQLSNETSNDDLMVDHSDGDIFGYSRHQASPLGNGPEQQVDPESYSIDRQVAANAISRLSTDLPGIEDVATLVTDEEVLVAYRLDPDADIDRNEAADRVKRTAISLLPRWYHVYVTDDPKLQTNIENLSVSSQGMKETEEAIASTIAMMKERSPQGYRIDEGENANGETREDERDQMSEKEMIQLAPAAMDIGQNRAADA
ncbi:YhcN/YlaJ family sporulation lipoprotein [Jeotgalibacillus soli]|uniref:Sporulation protein n=1 Tax=Jeotgalibacillus soli TaxID=889306 RepID=A0A0C2RLL9_9BACL|nr:YhcN/YlaJ family sporulation lipoprotein [Jeotgalibacillus soli]KIL42639.1 hypothetical protein KP78_38620 [Jeotgalibacillus soli]